MDTSGQYRGRPPVLCLCHLVDDLLVHIIQFLGSGVESDARGCRQFLTSSYSGLHVPDTLLNSFLLHMNISLISRYESAALAKLLAHFGGELLRSCTRS